MAKITKETEDLIIALYTDGAMKVVDIADKADVSVYSVYQVLKRRGVSKKSVDNTEFKAVISFDKEATEIIREVNPNGLSKWVCELIKKAH